jgi:hypothetical protein
VNRRLAVVGLPAAGAALVACFELSGPPASLSSVSTLEVAWPSVVIGDSLRDWEGTAVPLRVQAFDGAGQPVTDAQVIFIALDTGLSVTASGFVMGQNQRTSPAQIVAQVRRGGDVIQTPAIDVHVVPRPDTVSPAGADTLAVKIDTLFGITDTSWVRSDAITVTVRNRSLLEANPSNAAVRRWIVRYEISPPFTGVGGEPAAFFEAAGNPQVAADTTDDNGVAARRRVVLRTIVLPPDSKFGTHEVKVTATVRERGQNVPGSPIEFVIPFEIRSAP